ncbi:histidine phosphotransfer domain-containing protein [Nitrospira sp. KM1]|uniref:Hpt domain-containing protein n=1 Tax=Nitrospira sp. KM1 TaxID=1936990 RepID=UPI0013A7AF86|nr:Hpt domain-containing protein [Nitrospira sp. KM1]BCA56372.1 histidine phosphotransfer domain-containing protein [Nitrospira sp. KM1]
MTDRSSTPDGARVIVTIDADLEEIVPGFLDNRRKDIDTLYDALQTNDMKTIRLLGHRMKGDGGGYGFEAISEIGDVLEQAAIRGDQQVIRNQVGKLQDFLMKVDVIYRR